ncbi:hypothetical protein T484DRAFT_1938282 [Baffinella frigidus]|jgi:hypothetical protein|nr:hypothetical protein T484DRAFT_1938282 [Cryptophyta sp. CCMP2293]|eukprot:CAMPEP_0180143086 /NCGR_PEP_ID=MMETSP0986-20121125/16036_1 /TAXON_ID=697907 /ORGANISM="non described non described, Strain CCMP2293" /LENGTH=153 /DNA_ID=CAMNT_0022086547 /DNA_START=213 /DNA_END=674 /DNA_ORIENTATION=-
MTSTCTLSKAAMVGAFVLCCGTPFAHAATGQKLTRMSCDLPEATMDGGRSTETAFVLWGASVAPLTQRPSLRLRGGDSQNRQSSRSHSPPRVLSDSELSGLALFELGGSVGVEKICTQDLGADRKNGVSLDGVRSSDGLDRARRFKLSRTVEI